MRRVWIAAPVVAVGLALAFGAARLPADAQGGTPVVVQGSMGEGITYEQIDFGTVEVLPPAPATINFYRWRFSPGVSVAIGAEDPGVYPLLVESGTLSVRGFTEDIVVRRAGGGEETVAAGAAATLGPGDSFVWGPYVGGEIANDGGEPVVVLTVNIVVVVEFPVGAATPGAGGTAATPEL